jgi:histidine triad (HIT) family protein
MYNHAPQGYVCPYCLFVQGRPNDLVPLAASDIVARTGRLTAFIATRKWTNNPGHVLIIPNEHFENIFDLPASLAEEIQTLTQSIALAMKAEYRCDGITIRQQNEPAGDQHIWHYHLHVIPRYENDDFNNSRRVPFEASERAIFAEKLKSGLTIIQPALSLQTQ